MIIIVYKFFYLDCRQIIIKMIVYLVSLIGWSSSALSAVAAPPVSCSNTWKWVVTPTFLGMIVIVSLPPSPVPARDNVMLPPCVSPQLLRVVSFYRYLGAGPARAQPDPENGKT